MFSRIEYGHTVPLSETFSFEPQIGFQFARLDVDGVIESGAGPLSLVVPGRDASFERSLLGARALKRFGRPGAAETTVELRGAWSHEFSPHGSLTMRFVADNAGNAFDVTSPVRLHDSAIVGASVAGKAFSHVRFVTSIDGDLSGPMKLWTASAGLRAGW